MKHTFLAWQDPHSRRWFPIGRLSATGDGFRFVYVKGCDDAHAAGFEALLGFPHVDQVYESEELFPFFANRTMSPNRADRPEYLVRLGLEPDERDPIVLLGRSEGRRSTDAFQMFPQAEPIDGQYRQHFFAHGLRHRPEPAQERVLTLKRGDPLDLVSEPENPEDRMAIMLQADNKNHHVGYVPRFLVGDIHRLAHQKPQVSVLRVNAPPMDMGQRLLCVVHCPWPEGFRSLDEAIYQPKATSTREYA